MYQVFWFGKLLVLRITRRHPWSTSPTPTIGISGAAAAYAGGAIRTSSWAPSVSARMMPIATIAKYVAMSPPVASLPRSWATAS
jgi:hypothetical protein